jgi:hypothetical protein
MNPQQRTKEMVGYHASHHADTLDRERPNDQLPIIRTTTIIYRCGRDERRTDRLAVTPDYGDPIVLAQGCGVDRWIHINTCPFLFRPCDSNTIWLPLSLDFLPMAETFSSQIAITRTHTRFSSPAVPMELGLHAVARGVQTSQRCQDPIGILRKRGSGLDRVWPG